MCILNLCHLCTFLCTNFCLSCFGVNIFFIHFFPRLLPRLLIYDRGPLPLKYLRFRGRTGDQSSSTFVVSTIFVIAALPFLFECSNVIVDLTLLIIKLVFLCIDNNHRVPNSLCNLFLVGTFQSHICNQIRNLTHFSLSILHHFECALRFSTVFQLRIKSFQPLKRRLGRNLNILTSRDNHYSIAVKVCTRKLSSDFTIDTNGIDWILTDDFNCVLLSIVHG